MLPTRCVVVKLKSGSVPRVREWAAEINRRKAEAIATLRSEHVLLEAAFLLPTPQGEFLVYVMKGGASHEEKADPALSPHPIDAYHQQFKRDAWESSEELETLIDLDRIAE